MNADPTHKMAMDAIGFAAQLLTPQADAYAALIKAARDAARKGTDNFKAWWRDNPDKRASANTIISDLKSLCAIADDQAKSEADPFAGSIDATDHDPTPEQIAAAQAEAEAFARSQEQE
jgi:hypothetical protein